MEGCVDTAVDGIGGRAGSGLSQRLRRQAAASGGGCRRTERTQLASNGSHKSRFARLSKIKVPQVLAPKAYLNRLGGNVTGGRCDPYPQRAQFRQHHTQHHGQS
jgi:hypothetical protein